MGRVIGVFFVITLFVSCNLPDDPYKGINHVMEIMMGEESEEVKPPTREEAQEELEQELDQEG